MVAPGETREIVGIERSIELKTKELIMLNEQIMKAIEKGEKVPQLDSRAAELLDFLKGSLDQEGVDPSYEWVVKARELVNGPSRRSMKLK